MNLKCIERLSDNLAKEFGTDKPNILTEICPPNMTGDITVNCFRLTGILKAKPDLITEKVVNLLKNDPSIEKVESIKAFVNITLKSQDLLSETAGNIDNIINETLIPAEKKKKVIVEYSAPNTNKPLHLGHLRNNTIGMSLASLLRRVGHIVFAINLINDRGIHICKSMIAYQRFGNGITPQKAGKKGDHLVGDFYVLFDKEFKKQISELKEKHPALQTKTDEELFLKTEIGSAAQETLRKWENNDPDTTALWKKMNEWVLDGFNETYKRMGVIFDKIYFESQTYMLGKDIVLKGLNNGLFKKRNDGAIYADLTPYKLNEKVLLRADGTSVYITQDIGTTIKKYEDFKADSQIWVVGDEQIHHFNTLFAIIKLLGYKWANSLCHLAYGMVNLPSGKMKSREGTVIDADDLFDNMFNLAKEATIERYKDNTPDDIDKRSEIISIGALKFMLLKYNPKTTVMFDPQASIKFEGDTGPYVQYVCARINSIYKKAQEQLNVTNITDIYPNWNLLNHKYEKSIAVLILLYNDVLLNAAEKLDCSILVNYLLELSKAFNSFYKECSVLNAKTLELKIARLKLCLAVQKILTDGLNTLTIQVPDAM